MKYFLPRLLILLLILLNTSKGEDALDHFFESQDNEDEYIVNKPIEKSKVFEYNYELGTSYRKNANIIVLNKITAKSEKITLQLEKDYYIGNIKICLNKCARSLSNTQATESKAFINVMEESLDEDSRKIFSGWVFSSNIGFNNITHPIYQIILLSCD